MEFQDVNDIAVSDLKKKGVGKCRILQGTLLDAGIWTLVYTCDAPQRLGSHFHVYLVDDETGQIVSPAK
jgi:hypothetical protein